jgi:hypothetical protein
MLQIRWHLQLGECFEGEINMKSAAILLAAFGLAVAGSAVAADHLTDADWLKANRCSGLAAGLGSGEAAGLDALVKAEGRSRVEIVYEKGQQEMARAKREAARADGKDRIEAELNGPCTAFTSGGSGGKP